MQVSAPRWLLLLPAPSNASNPPSAASGGVGVHWRRAREREREREVLQVSICTFVPVKQVIQATHEMQATRVSDTQEAVASQNTERAERSSSLEDAYEE